MLKNVFESDELIISRPNPELLDQITRHNQKIEKVEKNTKWIAIAFVLFMAILWIGGDLAGWNSGLILLFGLLTIFGFPLIWGLCAIWISRPSVKRHSEEMCTMALSEMSIPDDSDEIELLFPKLLQDDFYQKKELPFTNGMYLTYTDNEALYFVDVTGTVRIPYSLMSPWTEWELRLSRLKQHIVFIDETASFLKTKRFAELVNGSDNYFVIVTRDELRQLPYSVEEIYGLRNVSDNQKYKNYKRVYNEDV